MTHSPGREPNEHNIERTSAAAVADRPYRAPPLQPAPGPYEIELGAGEALGNAFRMWSRDLGRLVVLSLLAWAAMIPVIALGVGAWAFTVGFDQEPSVTQIIAFSGAGFIALVVIAIATLASNGGMMALADESEIRRGVTALASVVHERLRAAPGRAIEDRVSV